MAIRLPERKSVATNTGLKRVRNNRVDAHLRQLLPLPRIVAVIPPAVHQQPLSVQLRLTPFFFPHPLHRRRIQQRRARHYAPQRAPLQRHLHVLEPHALKPLLLRHLRTARLLV